MYCELLIQPGFPSTWMHSLLLKILPTFTSLQPPSLVSIREPSTSAYNISKEPFEPVSERIIELQKQVSNDPYFQVPGVIKKKDIGGYFFHAKEDLPEIRKLFFDFIKTVNFSFEAVVARKSIERFVTKHKDNERYFYADILSHLLKNKLRKDKRLVLNLQKKEQVLKI